MSRGRHHDAERVRVLAHGDGFLARHLHVDLRPAVLGFALQAGHGKGLLAALTSVGGDHAVGQQIAVDDRIDRPGHRIDTLGGRFEVVRIGLDFAIALDHAHQAGDIRAIVGADLGQARKIGCSARRAGRTRRCQVQGTSRTLGSDCPSSRCLTTSAGRSPGKRPRERPIGVHVLDGKARRQRAARPSTGPAGPG